MTFRSLAGRRCIITGASRGIGAAIAHRFAAEGATCVLIGRHQATLETLSAALLRDKFVEPNPHRAIVGDVADRSFWARLTVAEVSRRRFQAGSAEAANAGGCLQRDVDVLVNAAGVTHYSLLVATQPKVVEEVVGTNLMGAVWGCQVMVKNMMKRRRGNFCVNDGVHGYMNTDVFRRLHHQCVFIA